MHIDVLLPDVTELRNICPGETFMTVNQYYMVTRNHTQNFITVVNLESGECFEFPAHKKVRREAFKVVRL